MRIGTAWYALLACAMHPCLFAQLVCRLWLSGSCKSPFRHLFSKYPRLLICVLIFYKTRVAHRPHSSENYGCLAVKMPLKADLQISFLVPFRAFCRYLVSFYLSIWFSTRVFPDAKNLLLAPKMPLFNRSFALLGHVFNGSKRLCLYHYNVFLCFSSRI